MHSSKNKRIKQYIVFLFISIALLFLQSFSAPSFATDTILYRGDIKIPHQKINNLALQYPVIILDGKYYLPLTEEFFSAIGMEVTPYQIVEGEDNNGLRWAQTTSLSINTKKDIQKLPESEYGLSVDLDNLRPLVTQVYVDGTMLRSNSPLYEIDGIAYICLDFTNDFPIDSTDVLLKGILPTEEVPLPSTYNTLDEFQKNNWVKNQGTTQNCWAYAALSMLELKIAKTEGEFVDLSEDHLITKCPVPSTSSSGGNWRGSASYFTRAIGPVSEKNYRRKRDEEIRKNKQLKELSPEYLVEAYHQVSGVQDIKNAIYNNGAVLTSMYYGPMRKDFYNASNHAYYCNEKQLLPTHELILVGWNDNISKDVFNTEPLNNGAFIALNSFGDSFGDNGLFYISYEDSLALKSAITIDEYRKNPTTTTISEDRTGVTHYETSLGKGDLYAVLKMSPTTTLEKNTETNTKRIREIGVFAGAECVVTAYYSEHLPKDTDKLVFLGETYFSEPGYKTIQSYYNIPLKDSFYIILKYSSSENFIIPIEAPYPGIDYEIYSKPDTSFIGYKEFNELILTPLHQLRPNGTIVLRLIIQ